MLPVICVHKESINVPENSIVFNKLSVLPKMTNDIMTYQTNFTDKQPRFLLDFSSSAVFQEMHNDLHVIFP